jgi:hypothetical protein
MRLQKKLRSMNLTSKCNKWPTGRR